MTGYTPAWSTVKNTVAGKLDEGCQGQQIVWTDFNLSFDHTGILWNWHALPDGSVTLYVEDREGEISLFDVPSWQEVSIFYNFDESNDYGGRGNAMSRELALLMVWGCAAALVVAVVVGLIWNPSE